MVRVRSEQPIEGVEVHDDLSPELVRDADLDKAVEDEAFFNERVTIIIHPSAAENDPDHVVLSVNGVNQPVFRNVPTIVKRKYVEVLAHMVETKYHQPARESMNPEAGNQLIGRSALAYPFEVIEDKNPKGRAWLERLRLQKA
jgi:hypothetical protein